MKDMKQLFVGYPQMKGYLMWVTTTIEDRDWVTDSVNKYAAGLSSNWAVAWVGPQNNAKCVYILAW